MRITWAGTFDPAFGRNRKLARLLELVGADVEQVRFELWAEDRVEEARGGKLRAAVKIVLVLPRLFVALLRSPAPDLYLVSYPGWLDAPVVAAVARIRRRPVLFDPFISLYDTAVVDRRLFAERSLVARVARLLDRWSLRSADLVLADTQAHLDYFGELAGRHLRAGGVLPLGADDSGVAPVPDAAREERLVVFHGTFVPLQGVATIADAAYLLRDDGVRIRMIGDGQDRAVLDARIADLGLSDLDRVGLLPLAELPGEIARATVCLGIFGASDKAGRVVPNKLYECVAVGRPVVTREGPAISTMFSPEEIVTVPAGDPVALAEAIRRLVADPERRESVAAAGHDAYVRRFHEAPLAQRLGEHLDARGRPRGRRRTAAGDGRRGASRRIAPTGRPLPGK